jgi:PadR family transcriptional regulator, regulatory protein PadR
MHGPGVPATLAANVARGLGIALGAGRVVTPLARCHSVSLRASLPYLCRIRAMRKTYTLVQVAAALMTDPTGHHWGYQLSRASGVRSGVMYPILTRLLAEGWLSDGWEDPQTIKDKRPPRRYYELTDEGRIQLGAIVAEASHETRFQGIGRLAGGVA